MRVLDRGKLRHQRKTRAHLALANRRTMRDHAVMARRQLRTKDYSEDARKRLGEAVDRARRAAGYRYRTDFVKAHGIKNLRGLEMLEQGQPGVGQAFLLEVAAALPGWNEDTPRAVLEGGEPPELSDSQAPPEAPVEESRGLSDEERSLVRTLRRRGWTAERIADLIEELRRPTADLPTVESTANERTGTDR